MPKRAFSVFVLCIWVLWLSACHKENDDNSRAVTTETPTTAISETGPYWIKYFDEEGLYSIIVKDKAGKEFYRASADGMGSFTMLDEASVEYWFSGGTELFGVRYFDIERGLVSPVYWKPFALGFGRVAYLDFMEGDVNTIIVHDIFDPEINRITFQRKGLLWNGQAWAPEADYTVYPFTTAEFLDEKRLHVVYLTVDEELNTEFVEEVLELN